MLYLGVYIINKNILFFICISSLFFAILCILNLLCYTLKNMAWNFK